MFLNNKKKNNRFVVLDIETTGLNKVGLIYKGHRIIEIGAVEIINRSITNNNFHTYINPKRLISHEAFLIHGISNSFLNDKPFFSDIYKSFKNYIKDSIIIVHNKNFDIKFLEYQIKKIHNNKKTISEENKIIDTLIMARSLFPGKKNNLDALCNRYNINFTHRVKHSALVDAMLLAEIYLRMTRLQKEIIFSKDISNQKYYQDNFSSNKREAIVLKASDIEKMHHINYLKKMKKLHSCLWMQYYNII